MNSIRRTSCIYLILAIILLLTGSCLPIASATSNENTDLSDYTWINEDGEIFVLPEPARIGLTHSPGSPPSVRMQTDFMPSEITPSSVIGTDGRYEITNTSTYPHSAIAFLTLYFPGSTTYATGFFVRSNIILTAAHNITNHEAGELTMMTIQPGGPNSMLLSTTITRSRIYVPAQWNNVNADYDYAIIVLPSYEVGNLAGSLSLSVPSNSQLSGLPITIKGFPYDKLRGTMWGHSGTINSYTTYRFWHNVDTYSGQSGSPVMLSNNTVIGIDTYGFVPGDNITYNSSTRITTAILDMIQYLYETGIDGLP